MKCTIIPPGGPVIEDGTAETPEDALAGFPELTVCLFDGQVFMLQNGIVS